MSDPWGQADEVISGGLPSIYVPTHLVTAAHYASRSFATAVHPAEIGRTETGRWWAALGEKRPLAVLASRQLPNRISHDGRAKKVFIMSIITGFGSPSPV
jgi:hypothetical protein